MAEIGERITWGHEGNAEPDVYKIGYGYALERLVNDQTEAAWIEQQYNTVYLVAEEELHQLFVDDKISEEYREWQLRQVECAILNKAASLFGDPVAELDEYSRHYNG